VQVAANGLPTYPTPNVVSWMTQHVGIGVMRGPPEAGSWRPARGSSRRSAVMSPPPPSSKEGRQGDPGLSRIDKPGVCRSDATETACRRDGKQGSGPEYGDRNPIALEPRKRGEVRPHGPNTEQETGIRAEAGRSLGNQWMHRDNPEGRKRWQSLRSRHHRPSAC